MNIRTNILLLYRVDCKVSYISGVLVCAGLTEGFPLILRTAVHRRLALGKYARAADTFRVCWNVCFVRWVDRLVLLYVRIYESIKLEER